MTDARTVFQLALIALGGWLIYLLAPILTPFVRLAEQLYEQAKHLKLV